jgi:hypothetical protein
MPEHDADARRLARAMLDALRAEAGPAALGDEARLSAIRARFAARVPMSLVTVLDDELARSYRAPAPTLDGGEPRGELEVDGAESLGIAAAFALLALAGTAAGLLWAGV